MSFYVYIIANKTDSEFFKGLTENSAQRLARHNAGESKFTSQNKDWYFLFLKEFVSKTDAVIYEKRIKRLNKVSLLKLINSIENILGNGSVG